MRHSIRLLRFLNWRRILVFTRNPLFGVGDDRFATYQTPQKAGGFRDFCFFPGSTAIGLRLF
jgi:hypothetical protein